jgi:hypothetical protein
MKTIYILLTCLLFSACHGIIDPVQTITFDNFSLEASPGWKKYTSQGFDSKVGGIKKGKDDLKYDFGMYSYSFNKETDATHFIIETVKDGYQTKLVKPRKLGKGLIGIHIKVNDTQKLTIYGESKNEEEILKIFESVKIL